MNNDTAILKKSKTFSKSKSSIFEIVITLSIFLIMAMLLLDSVYYSKSVIEGLKLFFIAVLPGLLPFMFLTKLLTNLNLEKVTRFLEKPMRALFSLPAICAYPLILSMISGYPIGSKITADLYKEGKISKEDIDRAALISSTSGPVFVIGSVGALMLKSARFGAIIFASNVLANILALMFLSLVSKLKKRKNKAQLQTTLVQNKNMETKAEPKSFLQTLSRAAADTASSLLVVGFYIAFFFVMIDMLSKLHVIDFLSKAISPLFGSNPQKLELSRGIMSGIIEMTRGSKMLSNINGPLSLSLISALISFGGLSIIFQSLAFLEKTPLKFLKFISGKLLQAVLSFCICLLFFSFAM